MGAKGDLHLLLAFVPASSGGRHPQQACHVMSDCSAAGLVATCWHARVQEVHVAPATVALALVQQTAVRSASPLQVPCHLSRFADRSVTYQG
jgi:hypothetical protein